jgi:hypothetical protein
MNHARVVYKISRALLRFEVTCRRGDNVQLRYSVSNITKNHVEIFQIFPHLCTEEWAQFKGHFAGCNELGGAWHLIMHAYNFTFKIQSQQTKHVASERDTPCSYLFRKQWRQISSYLWGLQ